MVDPLVIPPADHTISRRQIDPDALKVLYRLQKFKHVAYLVGGSVRDLLLNRHPKDFDLGTSAHPHEVKRLFRNCWIIGRRFRLAHVKFGPKTIEVATFRRQVPLEPALPAPAAAAQEGDGPRVDGDTPERRPVRRDNTFGTAEEDAFRRDFTVNALFYDIATFSVIDFVGGVGDLRAGIIRSIGDPNERFIEDPVRMLRAVSLAARLNFRIDEPVRRAIARHKGEIAHASPARMIEELYKILRSGVSAETFKSLSKTGLLKHIAPDVDKRASKSLWQSLEALDAYRMRFKTAPQTLSNPILLGSLVVPVQHIDLSPQRKGEDGTGVSLGQLPVARRDAERLRQLLTLQPRLVNASLPPRARWAVMHRGAFEDAMTWLEVHGADPESLNRWNALVASGEPKTAAAKGRRRRRPRGRGRRRSEPNRS